MRSFQSVHKTAVRLAVLLAITSLTLLAGCTTQGQTALEQGNQTNGGIGSVPAKATQLAFAQTPPANLTSGQTFSVSVRVADANGNLIKTEPARVTLTLIQQTGTGALFGTKTVDSVNGYAIFTGLSVQSVGAYTITASAPGLTSVTLGTGFNVNPGPAGLLDVLTHSSTAVVYSPLTVPITATVMDANGNPIQDGYNVQLSATGPGAVMFGTSPTPFTVALSGGVANFGNAYFTQPGNYTITLNVQGTTVTANFTVNVTTTSYFAIQAGSLVNIDTTTTPGAATYQVLRPATIGSGQYRGLSVLNGTFYTINTATSPNQLVTIDPATGAGTPVAASNLGTGTYTGLTNDGTNLIGLYSDAAGHVWEAFIDPSLGTLLSRPPVELQTTDKSTSPPTVATLSGQAYNSIAALPGKSGNPFAVINPLYSGGTPTPSISGPLGGSDPLDITANTGNTASLPTAEAGYISSLCADVDNSADVVGVLQDPSHTVASQLISITTDGKATPTAIATLPTGQPVPTGLESIVSPVTVGAPTTLHVSSTNLTAHVNMPTDSQLVGALTDVATTQIDNGQSLRLSMVSGPGTATFDGFALPYIVPVVGGNANFGQGTFDTPGTYVLRVAAVSNPSVNATVTVTVSGDPTTITASPTTLTGTAGTAVATPLTATATDTNGNQLYSGDSLTLTVSGPGTVTFDGHSLPYTVPITGGTANFGNGTFSTAGNYTLTITSVAAPGVSTTVSVTINP